MKQFIHSKMLKRNLISLQLLFIILSSLMINNACQKDCLDSAGEKTQIQTKLSYFNKLNLQNNFIVHLIQDSLNMVEIKGNKNIISHIQAEVKDSTLSFNKSNTCDFLKAYPKQDVYIHFTHLENIFILNSPEIYADDTLSFNQLKIEDKGNAAKWDFSLNAQNLQIFLHAISGEMKIAGHTTYMYLYSSGTNNCFFKNLQCDDAGINHNDAGDIYLSVKKNIWLDIYNSGDFYCYGNPPKIDIHKSNGSSGRFYKMP